MALFISSLNSGSNGNCFYISNEKDAILVDAGISCREIEKRMKRLGLDLKKLKAVFVSHEHSDHISGVPGISKKYQLPVYITDDTRRESPIPIEDHLVRSFSTNNPVWIGDLSINGFRKSHDACDPHSFLISFNNINVGVFTDIGYCCKEVKTHFGQCHAVFLESNYCEDMLMNGHYPIFLKQRIHGDKGHLSNNQALDLFKNYRGKQLSHLILSHLSKNNNSPQLVDRLFRESATHTEIIVASRYNETPVYRIEARDISPSLPIRLVQPQHVQLSLF